MKQSSETAVRNRESIRTALAKVLPDSGLVLEIGSGTGEHAVCFAAAFPNLAWQPSDIDPAALASIAAWHDEAALTNLLRPIDLDATSTPWPIAKADAIACIDVVHVTAWDTTIALFANAARALPAGGLLFLYGAFKFHGRYTAPRNEELDRELRARDASWGLRDIRELTAAGTRFGIALKQAVAMPHDDCQSLIFRREQIMPPTAQLRIF
jgi:SAM-dependent methyltransferase